MDGGDCRWRVEIVDGGWRLSMEGRDCSGYSSMRTGRG